MSNPPLHTSPHFRWRAGMRRSDGAVHLADDRRPVSPNTEPDLNDPGTVGHVLALYRLATDDPWANLEAYTEPQPPVDPPTEGPGAQVPLFPTTPHTKAT